MHHRRSSCSFPSSSRLSSSLLFGFASNANLCVVFSVVSLRARVTVHAARQSQSLIVSQVEESCRHLRCFQTRHPRKARLFPPLFRITSGVRALLATFQRLPTQESPRFSLRFLPVAILPSQTNF
jgi:hypothetical protein